jgi:glyoxylase-like metal-dependent hydrolase (beta-lactamase superfamily II)
VLTCFSERLIETSVHMRSFLQQAGCSPPHVDELCSMYVQEKRAFLPVAVDDELYDGQDLHGMRIHHVPGHCPGQVMLQVDNVLLTADHLLARITPNQSPERITPWTGLDHYLASLAKTRSLIDSAGIDLALGGHEDPIRRPADRVRETMEFHHQRLGRVLQLCRQDRTLLDVCSSLFGEQQGYGRLLGLNEAAAHVEYLARRGYLQIVNIEDLLKPEPPAIRYRISEQAS